MGIVHRGQPLKTTFVRAARLGRGTRVLEWRSDATGRVHEVLEVNSDRLEVDLVPGDSGYLWFSGRDLHVTEGAEPTAVRRTYRRRFGARTEPSRAEVATGTVARSTRLRWLGWALPLLLIAVVVWQLLASYRP